VCAACVALSVTFPISDTDFWEHLLVGRVIWETRSVPTTHLWSWPTYGSPDVNASWGFRALIWPVWSLGGVGGLFAWRWLTTLAAFAMLLAAARRMGARGLSPFVAMALGALVYRERSQVRPETLVAVLFALQIWILETRRAGGPDRSLWLVPLAWAWANAHISYHLGLVMLSIHLLAESVQQARGGVTGAPGSGPAARRRLVVVALATLAVSFVNPFGWRALWRPFQFVLSGRGDPIYQTIGELMPLVWSGHLRHGLALLMLGWPVLLLWRARRHGWDLVELLVCACFTLLALTVTRFIGFYALAAAPYLARDLDAWVRSRHWPAWSRPPLVRASCASAACLALGLGAWTDPVYRVGIGMESKRYPIVACDFMARHGIQGHGFNPFHLGGYMLHRFWPDRGRLPFMDIHQSGTAREHRHYLAAFTDPEGWRATRNEYRIDYVLAWRVQVVEDRLLDFLDADTTFALVFLDDAAALFVRRHGALAAVADSFAYRELPAGRARLGPLGRSCSTDSVVRLQVAAELRRQASESPFNATAHSLLANIALIERRWGDARRHLLAASRLDHTTPRLHERLGFVALEEGRPREAIRELRLQRAREPHGPPTAFLLGQAHQRAGDFRAARKWYRRALETDPQRPEARDSLLAVEAALGRPR
jgi:tetratricopeptide repeat protein